MTIGHDPIVAHPRSRWLDPVLVGLLALVIGIAGSWVPSYWSGEATTLQVARLPLTDIWGFLGRRDLVDTVYDLGMHFWITVGGEGEFWVRLPSALSAGIGAAGVLVLVRMLTSRRTAVATGIVFAVLPRVTWAAVEARPSALTAAIAVWLTVLVITASRSGRRVWWIAYGALLGASVVTFVGLALLVVVHGLFLAWAPAPRRRRRASRRLMGWAVASAAGLAASSPAVILESRQRGELDWLTGTGAVTWWTVLFEPWFETSLVSAALAVGLLIALGTRLADRSRTPATVVLLGAVWVIAPTVLLLVADLVAGPVYLARYLTFASPGLALLLGAACIGWRRRWIGTVLVVAVVLASVPTIVTQRLPDAKGGGSDLRPVAAQIAGHAHPGDAFVLGNAGTISSRPRQAFAAYPGRFAGLDDVALEESATELGTFTDETYSVTDTTGFRVLDARLKGHHRLWLATLADDPLTSAETRAYARLGFHVRSTMAFTRTVVSLLER